MATKWTTSGEMRHKITIQSPPTDNTGGISVGEWTYFCEAWAKIEPLSGKEYMQAQDIAAYVTARICLRYVAGVTPMHKVVFGDREYDVQTVINVEERNRELQLMVRERI